MKNSNLNKAKAAKNDEFYTQLSDIEKELQNYDFKDKVIYCNCDGEESNFVKYFKDNKEVLGYKDFYYSGLPQSFNSPESIELMANCDVVVTNPPFSLFRDFVKQITELEKDFLIIGNMNAITYKECFSLIKDNKMRLGVNSITSFVQPDGTIKKFGNICWFTNIKHHHRNEDIFLYKTYNKEDYPSYDNYTAIEVSKTVNIPCDFDGVMGVPISFLTKYNPDQFKILGTTDRGGDDVPEVDAIRLTDKKEGSAKIKGEKVYKRLFIKRRNYKPTMISLRKTVGTVLA